MFLKKVFIFLVSTCLLLTVFSSYVLAKANHPSTEGNTNISSILTYDDMIKELESLEKRSKGKLVVETLEELGYENSKSEEGRDLYVAKIGKGPEKVWIQGRIHGNEPYGTEATLELLKMYVSNQSPEIQKVLEELTLYVIPMYNPDGSEKNTRGNKDSIDLNRDWKKDGFEAVESLAWFTYWAEVKPDFGIDIHHQGLKKDSQTGEAVTMSLGVSLAPGGPTLPGIKNGEYDEVTRQAQVYVYDSLKDYGYTNIDRYTTGNARDGFTEIDIKGGVVSAMMLGLEYDGINEDNHSHPAVFFETSGNTRDGNLGQKARGHNIRHNVLGIQNLLYGLATGEVYDVNADRWDDIPRPDIKGYQTDYN